MVVGQAAAAVLGGGALAVRGSSSENGAISLSAAHQMQWSARPRGLAKQTGSVFVTSLHRSFKACVGLQPMIASASSVNGVAGDDGNVSTAAKVGVVPAVEEEIETTDDAQADPIPETSISAFMADVANLVKLVDSRDIFELELKHKEYEIVIRKEAPQPTPPPMTFPGPHVMAHTSFPGYGSPPPPTLASIPLPPVAEPVPVVAAAPPPPAKPSHPPMLSPMAGTFYRSPGPGEPAFVQVGDTVIKGQVVCIVEAMKLMNEIEADQSGTIVEILAEDGKPLSIESPLFSIKP